MVFIHKFHKILCCLLLIALTSCKKCGNGYVKGTIYQEGTSKPMANATLRLTESYHNGDERIIDHTITNETGKYNFNYKHRHNYKYTIYAGSYVDGAEGSGLEYKKSEKDFSLIPPAFLKVWANKTSSSDNYLIVNIEPGTYFNDAIFSPKHNYPFNELINAQYIQMSYTNYPNYAPYFFMKPNTTHTLKWVVYSSTGPTPVKGEAQFIANRGDTVSYTISFN